MSSRKELIRDVENFESWQDSPETIFGVLRYLYQTIRDNWANLKRLGFRSNILWVSVALFFFMYLFKSIGIGLLVPIARGILNKDFSMVLSEGIFQKVLIVFPFLSDATDFTIFVTLCGTVCIATTFKTVIEYFANLYLLRQKLGFSTGASKYIFQKYLSFGKRFFDETSAGRETGVVTRIPRVFLGAIQTLINSLNILIEIFLVFALIFILSWKFALLSLLFLPTFVFISKTMNERMKNILREGDEEGLPLFDAAYSYFMRVPLMKAYNAEKHEAKKFHQSCQEIEEKRFNIQKVMSLNGPVHEIITMLLLLVFVSILAFFSFYKAPEQTAPLLVIFLAFQNLLGSVRKLSSQSVQITRNFMNLKKMTATVENIEKYEVPSGDLMLDGLKQGIKLNHLNFSYKSEKKVLKDASFDIPKGKFTAIVGQTGSGKSTVISLLLRFYECNPDSILIDGVDIRNYDAESIRRNISYISQDAIVFKDTLYNNIVYGYAGKVDAKRIDEVLEKADLTEFVDSLPDGILTEVGDRGMTLSGGEKQRIAIARALLRDAPIIIMDEPTSSLDMATQKKIQEAILPLFKDKTMIVISHRLSVILGADNIIVLKKGEVVQQGSFDTLVNEPGLFRKMYRAQGINEGFKGDRIIILKDGQEVQFGEFDDLIAEEGPFQQMFIDYQKKKQQDEPLES